MGENDSITGDVVDQAGNVIRAAPAALPQVPGQRQPPPAPPPRPAPPRPPAPAPPFRPRRRWPIVLGVVALVLLCCVSVPGGIAVWWFTKTTIDAGKGATTPMGALELLAQTFDDSDGDFLAHRYVVAADQKVVLGVRAEFLNARKAHQKAFPNDPIGELKIAGPQPGDTPTEYGDTHAKKTNVLAYYSWDYPFISDTGEQLFMSSGGLPWRAEATKESDGWRISALTIPPWCGVIGESKSGYIRCDR